MAKWGGLLAKKFNIHSIAIEVATDIEEANCFYEKFYNEVVLEEIRLDEEQGKIKKNELLEINNWNEYYNRKTKVQNIEMDIAISVTEKEGNKSGIGIAKIINVGTSSENAIQNESVSKIKFSIPLVLPTSNTREYYQKYVKD